MSSLTVGAKSLFKTSMTAMLDAIASTGSKAIVATLEDKTRSPEELVIKCIEDEGPETFWKAAFGSVLAKLNHRFTPYLPEQLVNIPGDLMGAFMHWKSSASQSLDFTASHAGHQPKPETLINKFFDNFIKLPTDYILKLVGLDKHDNKINFTGFGLANILAFGIGTYALRGSEEDNIPGVNIDSDDSKLTTALKTLGYVAIEQVTHIGSQWMRYYQSCKDEFGEKFALSKSLANVINEKTFPGNFISSLGTCLFTLWFDKKIPKSAAGALGEIAPKAITRLLEARLRRSTKDIYDENSPNQRKPNHRIHDYKWLDKTLDAIDSPLVALRKLTINHIVAPLFKPVDMNLEDFRSELFNSFDLPIETLKKEQENELQLQGA